jgi:hypothetical protein
MSNERKPLLSDDVMAEIGLNVRDDDGASVTGNAVRDFYEQLITDGKLRVVEDAGDGKYCKVCDDKMDRSKPFCSGCGNPIYKP